LTVVTGASGGNPGDARHGVLPARVVEDCPDLARRFFTIGRYPRAGHDRARWDTVDWGGYRARIGIGQQRGPWRIGITESRDGDVSSWVTGAERMPHIPGWYTVLTHTRRGVVMSDVPAEIAGSLPFTDHAARLRRPALLIGGLGLGILPAWLLANAGPHRIDVGELDPDVITLMTGDAAPGAPNQWALDPRLHIHRGDIHTWWPAGQQGCALHPDCQMTPGRYDAAFFDIWDTISPANLPSMHRLTRRFTRRAGTLWSWERAECEAMRRRGQTLEWPCWVSETGYAQEGSP
jgi:hypothetical protein